VGRLHHAPSRPEVVSGGTYNSRGRLTSGPRPGPVTWLKRTLPRRAHRRSQYRPRGGVIASSPIIPAQRVFFSLVSWMNTVVLGIQPWGATWGLCESRS